MGDFVKVTGNSTSKENARKNKKKSKSKTTIIETSDNFDIPTGNVKTITTKSKEKGGRNPKSKTRRVFKSFDSDGNVIQKNVQKIVTRKGRTKKTNYNTKRRA